MGEIFCTWQILQSEMNLVLIYNALKYGMKLLVGQVLILNFSIFCVYTQKKKTYQVGIFQKKLGLRPCIFLATLISEMNIQIKNRLLNILRYCSLNFCCSLEVRSWKWMSDLLTWILMEVCCLVIKFNIMLTFFQNYFPSKWKDDFFYSLSDSLMSLNVNMIIWGLKIFIFSYNYLNKLN